MTRVGAVEQQIVVCDREGCDWSYRGEKNDCTYELSVHQDWHDAEDARKPALVPEPELKRTIGSTAPRTGEQQAELERLKQETVVITVRCFDCLEFEETGPAKQARRLWAVHRRDAHGDEKALVMLERGLGRRPPRTSSGRLAYGRNVGEAEANLRKARLAGAGTGVVPGKRRGRTPVWTEERVISEIKQHFERTGQMPSHSTNGTLARAGKRLFGTWPNAIERAGFPRPVPGGQPGSMNGAWGSRVRAPEPGGAEQVPDVTVERRDGGAVSGEVERNSSPLVELARKVDEAHDLLLRARDDEGDAARGLAAAIAALDRAVDGIRV